MSDALWSRLDSIVKQWIYGTIYADLLQTVLYRGDFAPLGQVEVIFQNNKHTGVVYLKNQFNSLHLSNFSDVSSYCTKIKIFKRSTSQSRSTSFRTKLALRLVSGLNGTDFDVVATMIQ